MTKSTKKTKTPRWEEGKGKEGKEATCFGYSLSSHKNRAYAVRHLAELAGLV